MITFELNNGKHVTFKGLDFWSRPIMEYKVSDRVYHLTIVDNKMYTTTQEGEPDYPLAHEIQLKEYDFDFMKGEFVKKEEDAA